MNRKLSLWIGVGIILFLIISYFIPIYQTFISNDIADVKIKSSLLRIIIFHNLFVLSFYVLVGLGFIFYGLRGIKFKFK